MSWKKNWFSYLMWFIYTVAVGFGLVCLDRMICDTFGIQIYLGIGLGVLCVALIGMFVFLLHRNRLKMIAVNKGEYKAGTVVEAFVAVILLAIGLLLRIRGIDGAGESAGYYEMASVTAGQSIPALVHGAEYFYLYLLRQVYYFLGNRFVAGIWLQIVVQFGAILVLYFTARYAAGRIAAIVMLGFCMLSSYMIQAALTLSPEMIFLLIWSLAISYVVAGYKGKLSPVYYLVAGMVTAVVTYIDVAGILVFLIASAAIFCKRFVETKTGIKMISMLLCILGFAVGFVGCIFIDTCLSGRRFAGVMGAWFQLYRIEAFRIPVSLETSAFSLEFIILFVLLTVGVFSFWRDRRLDYRKTWIAGTVILVTAGCYGVFTDSVPAGLFLYLVMILLAGISLQECFILTSHSVAQVGRKGQSGEPERRDVISSEETVEPVRRNEVSSEETVEPERRDVISSEETVEPVRRNEVSAEESVEPERRDTVLTGEAQKMEEELIQPVKEVKFIENPLPLPKKHKKKVLGYDVEDVSPLDDFDIEIDDNDDFDI